MDPSDLSRLETFLEPSRIVIVATIGRDGTPHLTPNWYVLEDGRLCISTTKERVKFRNLSRDDRISLCVCSEPLAGEYVTIWGRAELIDDESMWAVTQRIAERYVEPGKVDEWMAMLRTQPRVLISVTPEKVMFKD